MNEYTYTEEQVNRLLALLSFCVDAKGLQKAQALVEAEHIIRDFKKGDNE